MKMLSDPNFVLPMAIVILILGMLVNYYINLLSEDNEKKPASEVMIQKAISRFPNIKNMIRAQLDTGKILSTQDLNRMIADCHLYEHNEAIRHRQSSNLDN
jgi:hypothetical protein